MVVYVIMKWYLRDKDIERGIGFRGIFVFFFLGVKLGF